MSTLKNPVTNDDHIQGDENAPITLVEYGDYQCHYCGAAYPIVKRIQKHFGKRLRFVFRNFPIVESHPYAGIAAMAAEFAATQNKFWEMHDLLYENQANLDMPSLLNYAKSLGLSATDLQRGKLSLAEDYIKSKQTFFEKIDLGCGERLLSIDLSKPAEVDFGKYESEHGLGKAKSTIEDLRKKPKAKPCVIC